MYAKPLVLIVDDDAELSAMVAELFSREGWVAHCVLTGGDGEQALATLRPDAVLLDVMLPDANGYELCRRWRAAQPGLGLLMFTARGDPMDRVLGLEIGADDYLAKPFEPRELVARVRALLRRQAPGRSDAARLRFEGLTIDLLKREVSAQAGVVVLTSVEYKLLAALARTPGQPHARAAQPSRAGRQLQAAGPHGRRAGRAAAPQAARSQPRQGLDRHGAWRRLRVRAALTLRTA